MLADNPPIFADLILEIYIPSASLRASLCRHPRDTTIYSMDAKPPFPSIFLS